MIARALTTLCLSSSLHVVLFAATAHAQSDPTLGDLFPYEASIEDGGGYGLARLPLSAEVLAASQPDLSDVRVVDAYDTEIPYVVDRGDRPGLSADLGPVQPLSPMNVRQERTRESAGFRYVESYEVFVGPPRDGVSWALRFATTAPSFVCTVRVGAVSGDVTHVQGSVFRLPSAGAERIELALPSDAIGWMRVELVSQAQFLSPRLELVPRAALADPPRLDIALELVSSRVEGSVQILELARPPGVAPEQVRIETASTTFVRSVEITAIATDRAARTLGRGSIFRVPGIATVEGLEVGTDASGASGDRLIVRIEGGDSPPLEAPRVIARVRRATLVFDQSRAERLRFGGHRVRAPRFDLAGAWGSSLEEALADERVAELRLGPVGENPRYDDRPLLEAAMRAGARVDGRTFARHATLSVPDAREGLVRVAVTPSLVSSAREDMGDVRVVSADGLQWPYVLSPSERMVDVPVSVSAPVADEAESGRSVYAIALPDAPSAPSALVLETDATLFDRSVRVRGLRPDADAPEELAWGRVARGPGTTDGLRIELPRTRVTMLELLVDDGAEAPLAIRAAHVVVPVRDLLLTAPAGEYRVLAGDPLASPPSYDLARAGAALLDNVPAADATIGAMERNPEHREPTFFERTGWEGIALWSVLGLAVLVLGALTLRLARSDDDTPPDLAAAAATATATASPTREPPPSTPTADGGDPPATA